MTSNPDTRESLILRLPSSQDALAWREFIAIYEPLIIRFAGRRGLQEADAREIAQNVLIAVAKSVDRWQPDRERGRFRAWLFRIARNQLINWISKQATQASSARALDGSALEQFPSEDYRAAEIELEYRREMFRVAAAQARDSFSASTWDMHLILLPIKLNDIIFLHHVLLLLLLLHVHLFLLGILVLFLVHHLLLLFALHLYLMMALRGQAALILPTR